MTTYYYTPDELKKINLNVESLCKATQFTDDETTNVRRDVRFFGVDLFTVNGKPLNQLHYKSDSKMLNLSFKEKYLAKFIKRFNNCIISKDPNYLLSDNSEFYQAFYRYNFIIILDKNNLSAKKRCFNMDGVLLTKVKDTLTSNGELNREGLEYTAIYKDTVLTKLERKINDSKSSNISSSSSSYKIQPKTTYGVDKIQHQDSQETAVRSITTIPEDSKVSISKSKDLEITNTTIQTESTSEESKMKLGKEVPHQNNSKNIPYKISLTSFNLLYVVWEKLLKFIRLLIKQSKLNLYKIAWSVLIFRLLKRVVYSFLGFLEASFLGWFITNPENWRIPSMEIQLPSWVSNAAQSAMEIQLPRWVSSTEQSTNVQVSEINLKDLPEINPTALPEINTKTLQGFELYREINPKPLPEIKIFMDDIDTGRDLYKEFNGQEISGQESNLPIILFGVVVIAVIIYIGWKHELFNDLIPKTGFFSNLLPGRKTSSFTPNIRDSMESTKEYDVEFIKNFIEDGKHTLDPVPYNVSDLPFSKIVCPKSISSSSSSKVKMYDQMTQTIDNFTEYEGLLHTKEKIIKDKQLSDKLLRDTIEEYERKIQLNDNETSNKILENIQIANKKITEYKREARESYDKMAEFKRLAQEALDDKLKAQQVTQEALDEKLNTQETANEQIARYKQQVQEANSKITEYKLKAQTSDEVAESHRMLYESERNQLFSRMKEVLEKKGHQWSPDILQDLISSNLTKPPVASTTEDIISVSEYSRTSKVSTESPRSPIHPAEYPVRSQSPTQMSERNVPSIPSDFPSPSDSPRTAIHLASDSPRTAIHLASEHSMSSIKDPSNIPHSPSPTHSERNVPSVYNPSDIPSRSESPISPVNSLTESTRKPIITQTLYIPEREYPRSPIKLLTESGKTHVPPAPESSSDSPISEITDSLLSKPGRVHIPERLDERLEVRLDEPRSPIHLRTDILPESSINPITSVLKPTKVHIPERLEEPRIPVQTARVHIPERLAVPERSRIHIPDRIEEPRSPIRGKWPSTSTSSTSDTLTYKPVSTPASFYQNYFDKSTSTSDFTSDFANNSTKELIDTMRADLIRLKGESVVHTPVENLEGIIEDLDKNLDMLANLWDNWF